MTRKKIASFVVLILVILSYCALFTPCENDDEILIYNMPGSSFNAIIKDLHGKNLILYPKILSLFVRILGFSKSMKAGEYAISPFMRPINILYKMYIGDVYFRKFAIIEGSSKYDLIYGIEENEYLTGELNGNLVSDFAVPDTYYFTRGESKNDLINRIRQYSEIMMNDMWEERDENLYLKSPREALILSSIIEKESSDVFEKSRISGLFINRLKNDTRLQSDPTVIFAITQGKYVLNRKLLKSDLKLASIYNTYLHKGLPPKLICYPGRDSIYAALHPEKNEFLYFVSNGRGSHLFARNIDEHHRNVIEYKSYINFKLQ